MQVHHGAALAALAAAAQAVRLRDGGVGASVQRRRLHVVQPHVVRHVRDERVDEEEVVVRQLVHPLHTAQRKNAKNAKTQNRDGCVNATRTKHASEQLLQSSHLHHERLELARLEAVGRVLAVVAVHRLWRQLFVEDMIRSLDGHRVVLVPIR
jgi:hypothetical protein